MYKLYRLIFINKQLEQWSDFSFSFVFELHQRQTSVGFTLKAVLSL